MNLLNFTHEFIEKFKSQLNYNFFFSNLLILIPVSLITGPAIPDIILSIIALYFLIISFKENLWSNYYNNLFVLGFTSFFIYLISRSLLTEDIFYSLSQSGIIFYFRYLFFSLAVWYLIDNDKNLLKKLFLSFSLCLSIVMIDGFYQYFNGYNLLGWSIPTESRLSGLFKDEWIIGSYVSKTSAITVTLIFFTFKRNIYSTSIINLILLVSIVFVFISGERMALMHLIIFYSIFYIFIFKSSIIKLVSFIMLIISLFLITYNSSFVQKRVITTIEDLQSLKVPYLPYTPNHEKHYITTLRMFKDNPVFGMGPNSFRKLCRLEKFDYNSSCSTHPHNFYIQHLGELGIFGFSFLFLFFIYLSYILFRQLLNKLSMKSHQYLYKDCTILSVGIVFFMIWPLAPTVNFYNNWFGVFLFFSIGLFLFSYLGERRK